MNRNNDTVNGLRPQQTKGFIVVLCKFVLYIVVFSFQFGK